MQVALAPHRALTDTTAQSSAFLPIPKQCNCTFPDEFQAFAGAFSYALKGTISNYHRVIDIAINTSIGASCACRLSDLPNGDSKGRTAGCSLMSMHRK